MGLWFQEIPFMAPLMFPKWNLWFQRNSTYSPLSALYYIYYINGIPSYEVLFFLFLIFSFLFISIDALECLFTFNSDNSVRLFLFANPIDALVFYIIPWPLSFCYITQMSRWSSIFYALWVFWFYFSCCPWAWAQWAFVTFIEYPVLFLFLCSMSILFTIHCCTWPFSLCVLSIDAFELSLGYCKVTP